MNSNLPSRESKAMSLLHDGLEDPWNVTTSVAQLHQSISLCYSYDMLVTKDTLNDDFRVKSGQVSLFEPHAPNIVLSEEYSQ